MCSNRAGCEGECDSCRKIDALVNWEPYGSKWQRNKQEALRTPEQEAASKEFFEKMLIQAQLTGDIYRNNLRILNDTRKENKDGNAIRITKPTQESTGIQGNADIKRKENVSVEGYCVWGQWGWQNHATINRKKSNNY